MSVGFTITSRFNNKTHKIPESLAFTCLFKPGLFTHRVK